MLDKLLEFINKIFESQLFKRWIAPLLPNLPSKEKSSKARQEDPDSSLEAERKPYSTKKLLGIILVSSFLLASTASTFLASSLLHLLNASKKSRLELASEGVKTGSQMNFKEAEESIIKRNLFNLTGEVPTEEAEDGPAKISLSGAVECIPTQLKLDLLGTIANDQNSIAIIQEHGEPEAQFYRVNDELTDYQRKIVKITANKVYLDRNECIELKVDNIAGLDLSGMRKNQAEAIREYKLTSAWVTSQIGSGYTNIMRTTQLIPISDPGLSGHRVNQVEDGSLLSAVGIQAGDVITQVGSKTLGIEDSFTVFESFLNERSFTLTYLSKNSSGQYDKKQVRVEIK